MALVRKRGEDVRRFILENIEMNPGSMASLASKKFKISRQAINKHLRKLVEQGSLSVTGTTRNRKYSLETLSSDVFTFELSDNIGEDKVWRDNVSSLLNKLPDNVVEIWQYGVTEMFNNVIDHSNGSMASVTITRTAISSEIRICDNGEGIFKKIQNALGLDDERHAILELAKGKLTTDPDNHSGEGIFFSSRVFDHFVISSGKVYFSHDHDELEDWILEHGEQLQGTTVVMKLLNNTSRTVKKIFDKYSTDGNFGFSKTVVPVRMTQYGDDKLVSRSQAKRLLSRIDRFKVVIFDFAEVDSIGQAFADEIFRVFASQHPDIELAAIHHNGSVADMVNRAILARNAQVESRGHNEPPLV